MHARARASALLVGMLAALTTAAAVPAPPPPPAACTDRRAGWQVYTCEQHRSWGQCGAAWMAGLCDLTCGRCSLSPPTPPAPAATPTPAPPCRDGPAPAWQTYTCAQHREWGQCAETWLDGVCDRTCERCVLTPAPTPTPTPTVAAACTDERAAWMGDYTCEQFAQFGKCPEPWMAGLCNRACRRSPMCACYDRDVRSASENGICTGLKEAGQCDSDEGECDATCGRCTTTTCDFPKGYSLLTLNLWLAGCGQQRPLGADLQDLRHNTSFCRGRGHDELCECSCGPGFRWPPDVPPFALRCTITDNLASWTMLDTNTHARMCEAVAPAPTPPSPPPCDPSCDDAASGLVFLGQAVTCAQHKAWSHCGTAWLRAKGACRFTCGHCHQISSSC